MKYIVLLIDGAADYPLDSLGGKTPLMVADKPNIDRLASLGELGLVSTIPKNMPPGSDVANLSVMGYDPQRFYSGRSPLEAVSMGINLSKNDTTFRANLVTLSDEPDYESKSMADYSAGEIETDQAAILISDLAKQLNNESYSLHSGISYRHLLLLNRQPGNITLTPPHDISGKCIKNHLPDSVEMLAIMKRSNEILRNHPINAQRIMNGQRPANSLWLWGQGTKPTLPSFEEKYGIKGCVISAVDLIKGIGLSAGMDSVDVDGATGTVHTNFQGKTAATVEALKTHDFVYLHLEAADECGHHFDEQGKIRAIELIDRLVAGPLVSALDKQSIDYKIMILPDHPTPLSIGTHTSDPVPYIIYSTVRHKKGCETYNEATAKDAFNLPGYRLMDYFIKGSI